MVRSGPACDDSFCPPGIAIKLCFVEFQFYFRENVLFKIQRVGENDVYADSDDVVRQLYDMLPVDDRRIGRKDFVF